MDVIRHILIQKNIILNMTFA
jgi:hypothetical protein